MPASVLILPISWATPARSIRQLDHILVKPIDLGPLGGKRGEREAAAPFLSDFSLAMQTSSKLTIWRRVTQLRSRARRSRRVDRAPRRAGLKYRG